MKNVLTIIIMVCFLIISKNSFACVSDCYKELVDDKSFLNLDWENSIILNSSFQDIRSDYYNLGETDDSILTHKIDWMSHIKFTENFGLTSTIRALKREYTTDFDNKYTGVEARDLNMISDKEYDDVHFRSLYVTYILPEINDYDHMLAAGTMPFQGGSWSNYKLGTPQEADGLSMVFDMPFDALVYVGDVSEYTNAEFLQFRVGHGEYMKFRDIYPQNENIGRTPYDTTVSFLNLDYKDGPHNIKLEAYNTNWVFESSNIGTARHLGFGYAYDKLDDDGYVLYGTVAASKATGSYMDYINMKLTQNRDTLISSTMSLYSIDYATASNIVDSNLSNLTPEYVAATQNLTLVDTGLVQGESTTGWSYSIGAKKEFWLEEYDVDYFVGAEYFRSSKDWVATTLRGFPRNGIDPLIKGQALDLYTGIKFDDNKILTFSVIHEDRKWAPTAINDVVGISHEDTNRNILTDRTIFRIDFVWMFLGL